MAQTTQQAANASWAAALAAARFHVTETAHVTAECAMDQLSALGVDQDEMYDACCWILHDAGSEYTLGCYDTTHAAILAAHGDTMREALATVLRNGAWDAADKIVAQMRNASNATHHERVRNAINDIADDMQDTRHTS